MAMSSKGSVTHWLDLLKVGDRAAAQPLWERYFQLLVTRARAALGAAPCRAAGAEDVALSAFDSFYCGAEQGRFPRLDDRNDLWSILLTITVRKAAYLVRHESCLRRGGGKVRVEADLPHDAEEGEAALARVIGEEPTPALAAQVAEEYRRLLGKLYDDELRSIAVWQMEGYTVQEIAVRLGRSVRTVGRKLAVIRDCWREENVRS
jgi:DNA-directed RNA polymerase specialized sigma24 family protein